MKLIIDEDRGVLIREQDGHRAELELYSPEAFELISRQWVRLGWSLKYSYTFTWFGRPIIQLPEDMVRIQEAVWQLQPDVIIECGVAHGGSLVLYAGIFEALGRGRVIGVDVEIRKHNRHALEQHILAPRINLVEGDSVDPTVVENVKRLTDAGEKIMVVLDSCHQRAHVLAELEAYGDLVSRGSYIVVADGIMKDLTDVPRGERDWEQDNPLGAIQDFLASHSEFESVPPPGPFSESPLESGVTYWPGGWMQRK